MILGISVDENFVYVSADEYDEVISLPFAIGRNLANKTWFIGDETKKENNNNIDIVIDKLFYIMENDGIARIGEEEYSAKELVKYFFGNLLLRYSNIDYVSIVVGKNNVKILSKIKYALSQCIKDESKYKITTYSEAFVAYLRNKGEEYYGSAVALFDFTEKAIIYYELVRYRSKDEKEYWQVNTKEYYSLPLDLLSGDAGKRVCDNILFKFAKECIGLNTYSHIILSGMGFNEDAPYRDFLSYVCSIAKVETDIDFFAKSAVILSKSILNDEIDKKVVLITDARTTASISLYSTVSNVEKRELLINPGEEWFYINEYVFDVILNGSYEIHFEILKVIEGIIKEEIVVVPEAMHTRLDKTNVMEVKIMYQQQNLIQITVEDKGFGEFFESTKERTERTIEI